MPLDLLRIQAICFDIDGTLSDTDDVFVKKLVKLFSPFNRIISTRHIQKFARTLVMRTEGPGNWAYSLADRLGLDGKIVALGDWFYQLGIGRATQPFQMIKGVPEMLTSLHQNYPLSIISARGQRSSLRFLEQFELLPYFTSVVTGQTCQHTKPCPDPIEWAANQMRVPAQACLMVGDSVVDIQCGKKSGAQTVGVLCGFGEREELVRAGADCILEYTPQLVELLENR